MTAPTPPDVPTPPTNEQTEEPTEDSTKYPYTSLLQQLETKAYQSLPRPSSDPTAKDSSESTQWDLSDDALLATLLHEFTNHIVQRTQEVSLEVKKLQSSVNKVGVDVATVSNEWMKKSRVVFMEQIVSQDTCDKSDEVDGKAKDINDDEEGSEEAEIARLEEEEKSAIQEGMKALSFFYDPKQGRQSSDGLDDGLGFDNDDDLNPFDADDDVIGDNCYYYPSAEGDVFNQRPLPFIVGSREFMESSCAGLGAVEETGEEVVDG